MTRRRGTAGDPHTRSLRRPKPVYSGRSCVLLGHNRWIAVPGLARPRLPTTANRSVREAGFSRGCSGPAGAALAATTMTGAACAQKLGGILRVHALDSPPSLSMHEEADAVPARATMGLFNNLVMFDQHAKHRHCEHAQTRLHCHQPPVHPTTRRSELPVPDPYALAYRRQYSEVTTPPVIGTSSRRG